VKIEPMVAAVAAVAATATPVVVTALTMASP